jgi:redox-sensitive bicupin YhaK (pirin superfamily)
MKRFRPGADRGHARTGWLDSRHGFSFGHYHDPEWMGWGPLRVINEDRVAPGAGFPAHAHANMEILSYVVSGALAHRDSTSTQGHDGGVLRAGQWQWMGAGHGIEHSEFNASQVEPVHFLQVWIQPDRVNAPPGHAQRAFDSAARRGRWATFFSPDGVDGSLALRQKAWVHGIALGEGEQATFPLQPARRYWLQLVQGAVTVDDRALVAGDAIGYTGESGALALTGGGSGIADLLLFDLPQ